MARCAGVAVWVLSGLRKGFGEGVIKGRGWGAGGKKGGFIVLLKLIGVNSCVAGANNDALPESLGFTVKPHFFPLN